MTKLRETTNTQKILHIRTIDKKGINFLEAGNLSLELVINAKKIKNKKLLFESGPWAVPNYRGL